RSVRTAAFAGEESTDVVCDSGTAGLRSRMGAGNSCMNRLVVIQVRRAAPMGAGRGRRVEVLRRRPLGAQASQGLYAYLVAQFGAEAVQKRCADIVRFLRETAASERGELRVDGPLVPAIPRVADQHRLSIEMHAAKAGSVQAALAAARDAGLLKSDAKTAIDVDPVSIL
ncbi:MAG: hypothetical protein ACK58T_21895, partial [Phycisphaerae bacterium]